MFHWQDGVYFERMEDGSVKIFKRRSGSPPYYYDFILQIDSDSWTSIITSVSKNGDNAENFAQAQKFHMGES